jgi:hypothetical protein
MNLVMAFALVVIVNGEVRSTEQMLFRNVHRCNFFSDALEKGSSPNGQHKITAYCEPKMVPENSTFWD